MNIMVFDVPAENGGALTILKQYYESALLDKQNNWYFVISTPNLNKIENIKVLKYPWVKKSWLHRLFFDNFVAAKLVKKNKIDEIISLQNIIIHGPNVYQTLYLHQSLPFAEKRYKLSENFKFWIYQNLISEMIFRSIKQVDKVIVQTYWMKEACIKKTGVLPGKFEVVQPEISVIVKRQYKQESEDKVLFFYPAGALPYKNHKIIIEAAKQLKQARIDNYRIVFTLKGDENSKIKKLYDEVRTKNLPFDFIGQISREGVMDYYSKSILIFPSYIESFGLPLLEAKMHGTPILASNCSFSHEILDGYESACFFDPFGINELFLYMKNLVSDKFQI